MTRGRWPTAVAAGVCFVAAMTAMLFLASSPFAEADGLSALPVLMAPVAVAAAGFSVALATGVRPRARKAVLWALAVMLVLFCLVGYFSVGVLYLPAAVAMAVAAWASPRQALTGKHGAAAD